MFMTSRVVSVLLSCSFHTLDAIQHCQRGSHLISPAVFIHARTWQYDYDKSLSEILIAFNIKDHDLSNSSQSSLTRSASKRQIQSHIIALSVVLKIEFQNTINIPALLALGCTNGLRSKVAGQPEPCSK